MGSTLSATEVARISRLCRIALSEEEAARMTAELSQILSYVEKLQQLNTADVPPTSQVTDQTNAGRTDRVAPAQRSAVDALIACAPEREGRGVRVPPVFS